MSAVTATWLLALLSALFFILGSPPAAVFVASAAIAVGVLGPGYDYRRQRSDHWQRNHGGAYRRRR